MDPAERIPIALSRKPQAEDYRSRETEWTLENALCQLSEVFPGFRELVAHKRVVDFGCGQGYQCMALALHYGCSVVGIESNPSTLRDAIRGARHHEIDPTRLAFVEEPSADLMESFDVAISQDSFEHFRDPIGVLGQMRDLIKPSGRILITFGRPG